MNGNVLLIGVPLTVRPAKLWPVSRHAFGEQRHQNAEWNGAIRDAISLKMLPSDANSKLEWEKIARGPGGANLHDFLEWANRTKAAKGEGKK